MEYVSYLGLVVAALYSLLVAVCVIKANKKNLDVKSYVVWLQIPLGLQLALLRKMGFTSFLERLSWLSGYILLGVPALLFSYFLGSAVEFCVVWEWRGLFNGFSQAALGATVVAAVANLAASVLAAGVCHSIHQHASWIHQQGNMPQWRWYRPVFLGVATVSLILFGLSVAVFVRGLFFAV